MIGDRRACAPIPSVNGTDGRWLKGEIWMLGRKSCSSAGRGHPRSVRCSPTAGDGGRLVGRTTIELRRRVCSSGRWRCPSPAPLRRAADRWPCDLRRLALFRSSRRRGDQLGPAPARIGHPKRSVRSNVPGRATCTTCTATRTAEPSCRSRLLVGSASSFRCWQTGAARSAVAGTAVFPIWGAVLPSTTVSGVRSRRSGGSTGALSGTTGQLGGGQLSSETQAGSPARPRARRSTIMETNVGSADGGALCVFWAVRRAATAAQAPGSVGSTRISPRRPRGQRRRKINPITPATRRSSQGDIARSHGSSEATRDESRRARRTHPAPAAPRPRSA